MHHESNVNCIMANWKWEEEEGEIEETYATVDNGERSRRETQRPERQGRQRGAESQRSWEPENQRGTVGREEPRETERGCGEGVRRLSREERLAREWVRNLGFTISRNKSQCWEPDGERVRAQVYSLLLPLFILLSIIFHFSLPKYCKAASKFS